MSFIDNGNQIMTLYFLCFRESGLFIRFSLFLILMFDNFVK
jgi:hypothetical protein